MQVEVTPCKDHVSWLAGLDVDQLPALSPPGRRFDAAIDLVGGNTQPLLFGWLKAGGKLISAVSAPDLTLAETSGISARFILVHVNTGDLEMIANLFDRGAIRPWIGEVLPLSEARAAHEMLARKGEYKPGKIVLRP